MQFRNHISGEKLFLSPEKSIHIQNSLGSDIMMAFDECPPYPAEHHYMKASVERTADGLNAVLEPTCIQIDKRCLVLFKVESMKI